MGMRLSGSGETVRKKEPVKKPPRLSAGDTIEFSLSQELPFPKGATTWCKAGATTSIRPGETSASARIRLQAFVRDMLEKEIDLICDF